MSIDITCAIKNKPEGFWLRKLPLKVRFFHFLRTQCYIYWQKSVFLSSKLENTNCHNAEKCGGTIFFWIMLFQVFFADNYIAIYHFQNERKLYLWVFTERYTKLKREWPTRLYIPYICVLRNEFANIYTLLSFKSYILEWKQIFDPCQIDIQII